MGAVEVPERGRNVTASARDPAEVVLDLGQCEIEAELRVEPSGREQIALCGTQCTAVPVHEAAVVECPSLPEPIAGPAEDRERRAVADECLVEAVVVMEENRALELEPRGRQPLERRAGEVELAKRPRRVSRVEERTSETHSRFRRANDELCLLGGSHRAPQLTNSRLPVLLLERREAERTFGQ